MNKKYELMDSEFVLNFLGKKLFRIRALVDIKIFGVKAGDKGGYVEAAKNLDVSDSAWVFGNAQFFGEARGSGNAWVFGDAQVYGNAQVLGNAWVFGNAQVCDNARVLGEARVYGSAQVYDSAWVLGNAQVSGNAWVFGNAQVSGNAWVFGNAQVLGEARVSLYHEVFNVTNTRWSFTSLPKGVQIGCHFHSMKEWKEKHKEIGQQNGLSKEESIAYYKLMTAVRRVQRLAAKRASK